VTEIFNEEARSKLSGTQPERDAPLTEGKKAR
jgi:hypothetical protein